MTETFLAQTPDSPVAEKDTRMSDHEAASPQAEGSHAEGSADTSFKPGDKVWAKLKGLRTKVLCTRISYEANPPVPKNLRSISMAQGTKLKSFEEHYDEYSTKNKTVLFKKALAESLDPSIVERELEEAKAKAEAKAAAAAERKNRKSSTPSKRRVSAPGSATKQKKSRAQETESDEESTHRTKKRRYSEGPSKRRVDYSDEEGESRPAEKKRRKSTSGRHKRDEDEQERKENDNHSGHESGHSKKKRLDSEAEEFMKDPQIERLWYLRTRLQKFLQKEGEYTDKEFQKADAYLREVEEADIADNLRKVLKHTKLGKVMRFMSKMTLEKDDYNLIDRSLQLTHKWKAAMGTEEDAAGERQEPANNDDDTKIERSNGSLYQKANGVADDTVEKEPSDVDNDKKGDGEDSGKDGVDKEEKEVFKEQDGGTAEDQTQRVDETVERGGSDQNSHEMMDVDRKLEADQPMDEDGNTSQEAKTESVGMQEE
ncbi:hypothetical protein HK104_009733 [Borealophlyctis nickersoniae]|nr:hypothetical protein HK104_009733 [Borealophlyctis nickersoniae]